MRETGGNVVLNVEQVLPEKAAERTNMKQSGDEEKGVVAGPDFERAALEEAWRIDAAGALPFLHEQAADEEAAEYEEDVDAGPAEAFYAVEDSRDDEEIVGAVVKDEHHQDGDPTDEIKFDFTAGGSWWWGHSERIASVLEREARDEIRDPSLRKGAKGMSFAPVDSC